MVLKRFSQALLAALPLVLLLAACGTDSEPTAEPVSKPPATSEPVPTPKPTATPVPEPKEPSMKQYNSPPRDDDRPEQELHGDARAGEGR